MNAKIPSKEKWFGTSNKHHNATHKMFQKNGTKRKIKQNFVRCIVYQQGIIKCCTKKLNKGIKKVFMENWLVWFLRQKVIIFEAERLVHYSIKRKANANFLNDNFQVPRKVSFHCQRPCVHYKMFYTSGKEFFEAKL
jgi:hypothetical protein